MKITKRQLIKIIKEAMSPEEESFFGPTFSEVIAEYEDPKNAGIFKDSQTFSDFNQKFPKLNLLGSGAFRSTYEDIDDPRFLLKVAKPGKRTALQDNITEINVFNQFPDYFPKVYYAADDGRFFIIERVQVLKGDEFSEALVKNFPDVFKRIQSLPRFLNTGVDPYEQSSDKIKNMWKDLMVSMETHRFDENFDDLITSDNPDLRKAAINMFKLQFAHSSAKVAFTTEEICEIIEKSSFKKLFNVINSLGVAFRELRGDNMGVDRNGRLILIDNSQLDKVGPLTAIDCVTPVRVDKDLASYLNPDAEVFDSQAQKTKRKQAAPPSNRLAPGQAKGGTGDFYNVFDPDVISALSDDEDNIPTELFDTEFDLENFIKMMKEKNRKEREAEGRSDSDTNKSIGTFGTAAVGQISEHFEKFLKGLKE